MKTVIIVSKCLRVINFGESELKCHFHFKGVCAGESLKEVILFTSQKSSIQKGLEYLMYVQLISCRAGILKGKIIKSRLLDDCWDQS